ncbi:MAG: exopolysaccharide biosynthesis polyprenyl glycosylphosphotransferase [Solirubrobacteraceae bacterium]|nr:exopolysaccharide biosynthesis polyprenyl glycosylphosphotransferase [Solirubrobacteraceae bacterium]
MSTERRDTTLAERSRMPLLLRPLRRSIERPITEGTADRAIKFREAIFRRSLALADIAAAGAALFVCINLIGDDSLRPTGLLVLLPLIIIAGKAHALYDRDELVLNKTTIDQAPGIFQCATLYALLVVLLEGTFIRGELGTEQIIALWATLFVATLLARRAARFLARRLTPPERCLFVGSDESFDRLRSKLPERDHRATIVGRMSLEGLSGEQLVDTGVATLHNLIAEHGVHRVIIEPSEARQQTTLDFVREAKATGVRVSLLPRILEVVGSSIEVDDVDGMTLLGVRRFGLSRSSKVTKRSLDAVGAGLGLIVLSPLLLAITLAIKLDTRGPVLFRQMRVGRGGRQFEMLKFRTMVVDAEALKPELLDRTDPRALLFKLPDDPRVTRVGRWLRGTSLDELPQLINVLLGEMSLVGPRPLIGHEDEQIKGRDRSRLKLTPGMTGHWQIQGSRTPLAEMIKLDYLYVAGWSLWGDVKILLRTGTHVVTRRGM